jgi:hypothetical protein
MTSEHDLDQLETLLDGELSVDEEYALRERIAAEPALAEALERLRAQRDLRSLVWRAVEPGEAHVATLVSNVRGAIRRDQVWNTRRRALQYVSGLAACILVGFLMGRFLPYGTTGENQGNGIVFESARGPIAEVMDTRAAQPQPRTSGFRVLLTDNYGRVIAEQRFDTFNEARDFTEDLRRAQNRYNAPATRQPQPQQPQPRVSDTFFIKGEF